MKKELTIRGLEKLLKRIFLPWLVLSILLIITGAICFYTHYKKYLLESNMPLPGWVNTFLIVLLIVLSGCYIEITHFIKTAPDKKHKNWYLLTLAAKILSLLLLLTGIGFCFLFDKEGNIPNKGLACPAYIKDSTLYTDLLRENTSDYIIKQSDSIDITGMDCDAYFKTKADTRNNLLQQIDREGHYRCGNKIQSFLNNPDSGKLIIEELQNDRFLYINEKVIPGADGRYFYKAGICVSRDRYNSIDSIASVAVAKGCIRKALDRLIFTPLQKNPDVSIYFSTIVNNFCSSCPGNTTVAQIRLQCGGNAECDSIYFIKGQYALSYASKLILKCLFLELQKKTNKLSVEFYGYTDNTQVRAGGITYSGGGAITNVLNQLLPDGHIATYTPRLLMSNEELSYARAYGCYQYITAELGSLNNVSFHYSGGGVNNTAAEESRQRTVKIVIKNN